jgi:transposase-like protein
MATVESGHHAGVALTRKAENPPWGNKLIKNLRSIFYAPSQEKAWECFELFRQRGQKSVPSAAECLERSIDSCLTFFKFPPEEWISFKDNQYH